MTVCSNHHPYQSKKDTGIEPQQDKMDVPYICKSTQTCHCQNLLETFYIVTNSLMLSLDSDPQR